MIRSFRYSVRWTFEEEVAAASPERIYFEHRAPSKRRGKRIERNRKEITIWKACALIHEDDVDEDKEDEDEDEDEDKEEAWMDSAS